MQSMRSSLKIESALRNRFRPGLVHNIHVKSTCNVFFKKLIRPFPRNVCDSKVEQAKVLLHTSRGKIVMFLVKIPPECAASGEHTDVFPQSGDRRRKNGTGEKEAARH